MLNITSPCALCLFSHSDGVLWENSKGFMATFTILPKIPAWYHIPLLPVHKIDLDTEGGETPEGSDKGNNCGLCCTKNR